VLEKTGAKRLAALLVRHAAMRAEWQEQIAASIRSGDSFLPPDEAFADRMEEMRNEMQDLAEQLVDRFGFLDGVGRNGSKEVL
jgi:hypothetical protein